MKRWETCKSAPDHYFTMGITHSAVRLDATVDQSETVHNDNLETRWSISMRESFEYNQIGNSLSFPLQVSFFFLC